MILHILKYKWILLGLFVIIIQARVYLDPQWVYIVYFSFFFQIIRVVYDYTLGWMPFPAIYILALWILYLSFKEFRSFGAYFIEYKYSFFYKRLIFKCLSIFGVILFLFYTLWGFNYHRSNIDIELKLETINPDSATIVYEALTVISELNKLRDKISLDSASLPKNNVPTYMEDEIRSAQKMLLNEWGVPNWGRVRIRMIRPNGILLRFSTAGIYIPFVMEGHLDAGLHHIQWPFVMAHEMAHGYGYTNEGDCNFIGFLTCIASDNDFIRYSAWLAYYRYLYYDLRRISPTVLQQVHSNLNNGIKNDMVAIRNASNKYPDVLPKWRDLIYESYLKSHGMQDGIQSYNKIVRQIISWKKSNLNLDLQKSLEGENQIFKKN